MTPFPTSLSFHWTIVLFLCEKLWSLSPGRAAGCPSDMQRWTKRFVPGLRELSLHLPWLINWQVVGRPTCWLHYGRKFQNQASLFDQRCKSFVCEPVSAGDNRFPFLGEQKTTYQLLKTASQSELIYRRDSMGKRPCLAGRMGALSLSPSPKWEKWFQLSLRLRPPTNPAGCKQQHTAIPARKKGN